MSEEFTSIDNLNIENQSITDLSLTNISPDQIYSEPLLIEDILSDDTTLDPIPMYSPNISNITPFYKQGIDGLTLYVWIKFADTPTSGMSDISTGKDYLGIAVNKPSQTESLVYSDYEWIKLNSSSGSPVITLRLDTWGDYTPDKAGWVLSAYLGNDLNTRVTDLENNPGGVLTPEQLEILSFWKKDPNNPNTIFTERNAYSTGELSAYGIGSGGGGTVGALSELSDVQLTSLLSGDLLRYNGSHWINVPQTNVGTQVSWGGISSGYRQLSVAGTSYGLATDAHNHSISQVDGLQSALDNKWTTDSDKISNWDAAYTARHSHSNKDVIDQLTQTNIDVLSKLFLDSDGNLYTTENFYSEREISAYGYGGSGGGGGGDGTVVSWGTELNGGVDLTVGGISKTLALHSALTDKQDKLIAGSGITIVGNTISSTATGGGGGEFWKLDENGNLFTEYNAYSTKELSAYGAGDGGGGSGGGGSISTLSDVLLSSLVSGQILRFNGTHWVNEAFNPVTSWAHITDKPSTFTPSAHTHAISDTINLQTTLDAKLDITIFNSHATNSVANVKHLTDAQLTYLNNLISWWKLDASGNLYTDKNLYSTLEVSAYGIGTGGGGGGIIETVYGYGNLGQTFNNGILTDTFNAYTINQINTRLVSVESGSATTVNTTGTGNAITAINKAGTAITATKGLNFLETTEFNKYKKIRKIISVNEFISVLADQSENVKYLDLTGFSIPISANTVYDVYGSIYITGGLVFNVTGNYSITFRDLTEISSGLYLFDAYNSSQIRFNNTSVYNVAFYIENDIQISTQLIYLRNANVTVTSSGAYTGGLNLMYGTLTGTGTYSLTGNVQQYSFNAANIELATTTFKGAMSAADKAKLDGIAAGAKTGTVTSVAMTVPTGLSVSGSPITTSGTLAVSLTSGYSIPTTAKQTQWDTAYTHSQTSHAYLPLTGGTLTGNLTAPTFIGLLTGNASTATKLQTARTIAGVSFDGTANIAIPFANLASKPTTLSGYGITDAVTLATAQTITGAKTFSSPVSITSTTTPQLTISYDATRYLTITHGVIKNVSNLNNPLFIGNESAGDGIIFSTGTSSTYAERMRINAVGNVGIGTTSPSQKLHVIGNILATGEITAYVASDIRLKENIKPITSALDYINKLNPVTYNWNAKALELNSNKSTSLDYGLIAQEVEEVLPNIVHGIFDDKYKSIDYIKLIPIMISAIKELKQKVNKL